MGVDSIADTIISKKKIKIIEFYLKRMQLTVHVYM